MQIPYVPPELIHEILGHLHGDKQVLESCSLVCKAWVYPSRSRLFASVFLDDTLVKGFLASSERSTVVIPYIRHVYFSRFGHLQFWDDCIPNLVGFQHVRSLTLGESSYCHLSPRTQSLFLTHFTGIVCFRLIKPTKTNASQLAGIICSFPRLEVLGLDQIRLEWPTHTSGEDLALSPRTISRHLDTLDIRSSDVKALAWVLSFENLPALRTLYLQCFSGIFKPLNDLLPRLRFLERLFFSSRYLVQNRNDLEFIDLSHHECLRTLHIRGIPSLAHDPTEFIIQALTSIRCTCLDQLTFDVTYYPPTNEEVEWSEVDAVLQSPQFSKLRSVQVNVSALLPSLYPIVDTVLASFRLSQCRARDILSVRSVDGHGRDFFEVCDRVV